MFDYFNVRVYDDEKTDLLKHWDNTFKYISRAKMEGSKVLVHCKMGISRSASVVIAYAMKAHNWNFEQALRHVKDKRTCIKPNKSFLSQLETYQGILDAMKNKEKLQRSKSETNLKSTKDSRFAPTPLIQMQLGLLGVSGVGYKSLARQSCRELKKVGRRRPKSWSPDLRRTHSSSKVAKTAKPLSQSLEYLGSSVLRDKESKTVLMPCKNGQNYSVSQNQIVHLQENKSSPSLTTIVPSVKLIVSELESNERKTKDNKDDKRLLNNLNLSSEQINNNNHNTTTTSTTTTISLLNAKEQGSGETKEIWDPGESLDARNKLNLEHENTDNNRLLNQTVWTSSAQIIHESLNPTVVPYPTTACVVVGGDAKSDIQTATPPTTIKSTVILRKDGDPFSNKLDRVFDREERKQLRNVTVPPNTTTAATTPAIAIQPIQNPIVADLRSSSSLTDPFGSRQSSCSSVDSAVGLGECEFFIL
jgi:protein phosphatase slingshot